MTTAVDRVARLRQTLGGRAGRPLTHSSYTTTGDTTQWGDATPDYGALCLEMLHLALRVSPLTAVKCGRFAILLTDAGGFTPLSRQREANDRSREP